MIGANIKKLRLQHGMTQKNLGDKLFVSAQAVSRWENDEVEPSISTILELAKIFNVTADEILGREVKEIPEKDSQNSKEEKASQNEDSFRQFLAVCEQCNSPIYNSNEIVRTNKTVLCLKCHKANEEKRRLTILDNAKKKRSRSFIYGTLASVASLALSLCVWNTALSTYSMKITAILFSLSMFTFVSCCILDNNFVGEMFVTVASWSIKLPGLIFTLDVDGCLWFISMKILGAILSFLLSIICFLLALTLGSVVSVFVYPYAIITNIKRPEKEYF